MISVKRGFPKTLPSAPSTELRGGISSSFLNFFYQPIVLQEEVFNWESQGNMSPLRENLRFSLKLAVQPSKPNVSIMRCFFLLILVLSVASSGFAQSNDEKKALSQFVESWPLLAPFLNWTVSGEGACTPPGFHGVECTLINGEYHVSAMYEAFQFSYEFTSSFSLSQPS